MSVSLRSGRVTCRHTDLGDLPARLERRRLGRVGRRADVAHDPDKRPQPGAPAGCARACGAPAALRPAVGGRPGGGRFSSAAPRGAARPCWCGPGSSPRGRPIASAWVSVERDERDAQRFWLSVIDELAGAIGEDELVERVAATPAFEGQAVVERLLSDLHSLEQPVVLVIDDLHELRSADALRWLELFVTGLPPELRLVDRHAPGAVARAARPAAGGAPHGDPRPGSALLAPGDATAHGQQRGHAVRRRPGPAARADRRVGRRAAAGGDLAGLAPRPRALRGRVLRQRADRGGLPAGRGAGAAAAGGPRAAPAHLHTRARERPAGRRPDRRQGLRGDPAAPRGRERLRHRARRGADVVSVPPPAQRSAAARAAARLPGARRLAAPRGGAVARRARARGRGDPARPVRGRLGARRPPAGRQLRRSGVRRPQGDTAGAADRLPGRRLAGGRRAGAGLRHGSAL